MRTLLCGLMHRFNAGAGGVGGDECDMDGRDRRARLCSKSVAPKSRDRYTPGADYYWAWNPDSHCTFISSRAYVNDVRLSRWKDLGKVICLLRIISYIVTRRVE